MKCKRVIFFFGWKKNTAKKNIYKSGCVKESDKPKRSWNEELMSNGKKAFNEHGLVICYHTLRWSIWILSRGEKKQPNKSTNVALFVSGNCFVFGFCFMLIWKSLCTRIRNNEERTHKNVFVHRGVQNVLFDERVNIFHLCVCVQCFLCAAFMMAHLSGKKMFKCLHYCIVHFRKYRFGFIHWFWTKCTQPHHTTVQVIWFQHRQHYSQWLDLIWI